MGEKFYFIKLIYVYGVVVEADDKRLVMNGPTFEGSMLLGLWICDDGD